MVPLCYNCVLNCGFRCFEVGNGHRFWFQGGGTDVDEGAVHTLFLGLLKIVPTFVLDRKCPCVIFIKFT